jgi:asparagine synthase (glutamine-hydrolysing)
VCGIVGWVDLGRDITREGLTLEAMTATMRQRGPDQGGTWMGRHAGLGHRRLTVIDSEGGRQPAIGHVGRDGDSVVLVYSGEVYNFVELRSTLTARGHRFETRSDTEVVLHCYLEWGRGCVDRLNGMFAFAVWDSAEETLLLARDRLGVKPLYYYITNPGGILFSSEPKGILIHPLFSAEIDEESLPILFNARLALPGETPLRGLREVKPGHTLQLDRRGTDECPYWQLSSHEHTDSLETTVRTIRELLEDIVQRQVVSDVPISSMLSGGLDSTTISSLASRAMCSSGEGPLPTFCVAFLGDAHDFRPTELRPELDAPYARLAGAHIGSAHHEVVLDSADLVGALPIARRARDLPSLGQFDTSMHLLFAAMRERSTVALSAEAADEVFGGYPWFHDPDMVWRDRFPWMGDAPRLADCLTPDLHDRVRPGEAENDRYRTLRARVPRLPGEAGLDARMREVLYFSLLGPLTYLLDRKDRMSMAVGLEVRVPFCDHRLVEYVWNIPWSMKTTDGHWKSLLRMAAADLVQAETLKRPKSGYPGTHDPAYDATVMSAISALMKDKSSPLREMLDKERIRALIDEGARTMTWLNPAHMLLPLVEIDTWMRDYDVGFH